MVASDRLAPAGLRCLPEAGSSRVGATPAALPSVSCSASSTGGHTVRPATTRASSPSNLIELTRRVRCPTAASGVTSARLSAFRPVTVVTCGDENRQLPGDGDWEVNVRKIATAGVAALQHAFELPNQPAGDGACTANLIVVPLLVLVDAAGHTLAPTPPTGVCGKPLDTFLEALHGVRWREVAVTKVRQLETRRRSPPAARRTGRTRTRSTAGRESTPAPVAPPSPSR